jgi:YD repeat-containing protein
MRISYDPEVDALSITFRETTVTTKHLAEGIAADYDAAGRLAGIEVLDAIRRFGDRETFQQLIVEGISPPPAIVRETPDKPYGK